MSYEVPDFVRNFLAGDDAGGGVAVAPAASRGDAEARSGAVPDEVKDFLTKPNEPAGGLWDDAKRGWKQYRAQDAFHDAADSLAGANDNKLIGAYNETRKANPELSFDAYKRNYAAERFAAASKIAREAEVLPKSKGKAKFDDAAGAGEAWEAFTEHPVDVAGGIAVESAIGLGKVLLAGTAGGRTGPVSSAAAVGYQSADDDLKANVFQAYLQEMNKRGLNPESGEDWLRLWDDEKFREDVTTKARTRAAVIGPTAAASAGIGGRVAGAVGGKIVDKAGGSIAGKVLARGAGSLADAAVMAPMDAASEAGAQLASEGEVHDPKAVFSTGVTSFALGSSLGMLHAPEAHGRGTKSEEVKTKSGESSQHSSNEKTDTIDSSRRGAETQSVPEENLRDSATPRETIAGDDDLLGIKTRADEAKAAAELEAQVARRRELATRPLDAALDEAVDAMGERTASAWEAVGEDIRRLGQQNADGRRGANVEDIGRVLERFLPDDFDAAARDALALKLHGADAGESAEALRTFWRKAELKRAAQFEIETPAREAAAARKAESDAASAALEAEVAAKRKVEADALAAQEKADFEAGLDADGKKDLTRLSEGDLEAYAARGDAEARRAGDEFTRREKEAVTAESGGEDLASVMRAKGWFIPSEVAGLAGELSALRENAGEGGRMRFFRKPKSAEEGARQFDLRRQYFVNEGFTQFDTQNAFFEGLERMVRGEKVLPQGRPEFAEGAGRGDAEARSIGKTDTSEAAFQELQKAFPELARQYDLRVGDVREELHKAGYAGDVPEAVLAARLKAEKELIVIAAEAWQNREKGAGLLMHEVAHSYMDTLPAETHAELKKLWAHERENKTGPLYGEDGKLRSELRHVEAEGEQGFREWFAERIARINEQWAADKLDGREPALLRKVAFKIREAMRRVWQVLARRNEKADTSFDGEIFEKNFKKFLNNPGRVRDTATGELNMSAPVNTVRVEGRAGLDKMAPADAARWMKDNARGVFDNSDTRWRIAVSGEGARHAATQNRHAHRVPLEALPELIRNGVWMGRDVYEGKEPIRWTHRFYVPAEVNGKPWLAKLIVHETLSGEKFYDARTSEIIKPANLKDNPVESVGSEGLKPLFADSGYTVGELVEKVKRTWTQDDVQTGQPRNARREKFGQWRDFAEGESRGDAEARSDAIRERIQELDTEVSKYRELEDQGTVFSKPERQAMEQIRARREVLARELAAAEKVETDGARVQRSIEGDENTRDSASPRETTPEALAQRTIESNGHFVPDVLTLENFETEQFSAYADAVRAEAKKETNYRRREALFDAADVARSIRDERASRGYLPEPKWRESAKDFAAPIDDVPMSVLEQQAAMAASEHAERAAAEAAALLGSEEVRTKNEEPAAKPQDLPAAQDVPDDFTPAAEKREYPVRKDADARASSFEGGTKLPEKNWMHIGKWAVDFVRGFKGPLPDLPVTGADARKYGRVTEGYLELKRGMHHAVRQATDDVHAILKPILSLQNPLHAENYERAGKIQANIAEAELKLKEAVEHNRDTSTLTERLKNMRERLREEQAILKNDAYYVFQNFVLYRDLLVRAETLFKDNGDPIALPFNLNPAEVKTRAEMWAERVKTHADKAAILEAVRAHEQAVVKTWDEMKARDVLKSGEWSGGKYYFPHIVLDKWNGKMHAYDVATGEAMRQYLKPPKGSPAPIETDYVKAMTYHLAAVHADNIHQDVVKNYFKPYDILEKVKADARFQSREGAPVAWEALVPKGYEIFVPNEVVHFRNGVTIDRAALAKAVGKLIGDGPIHEELKRLGLENMKLPPEIFQNALVADAKEKWVLPSPVAEALRDLRKKSEWQPGSMERALMGATGLWKKNTLFAPWNTIRYNFNNLVPDSMRILGSSPETMAKLVNPKHWKEALREVHAFFIADEANITPDVREAFKYGVFDTPTEREVNAVLKSPRFKEIATGDMPAVKVLKMLGTFGVKASQYREAVFRYTLYKTNLERYRNGAVPDYGGAYWRDIEGMRESVPGANDAMQRKAAAISLKTLNDFGALSESGEKLRRHLIPFFAFQETNFKWFVNTMRNMSDMTFHAQEFGGDAKTGKGKYAQAAAAGMALRMVAPLVALQLFNTFFPGNEGLEDQISEEDRRRPHLLFGKDAEGRVRVVYMNNDIAEVLRWFGGARASGNLMDVLAGRTDFQTAAEDWAKNSWKDVANNAASVSPFMGAAYTGLSGKAIFPDVTEQRSIPKSDLFWNIIGQMSDMTVRDAARWVWDKDYYSSKDFGDWASQAIGQIRRRDPEQWAYYSIRDKAAQFLEDKTGRVMERGSYDAPEAQVLRNFRRAIYKGDVPAAIQFYNRLLEFGYTAERLKASIKSQDPLGDLPKTDGTRAAFVESLGESDREMLRRAMLFYQRMTVLRGNERGLFPHEVKGNEAANVRNLERYRENPREQLLRDAMAERLKMDAADEAAMLKADQEVRRSLRKR